MEPEVIYIHLIESQIKRINLERQGPSLGVCFTIIVKLHTNNYYWCAHLIGLSFKRESTVFCHTISLKA